MKTPQPSEIEAICANYGNAPDQLLEILRDVQTAYGHVPESAIRAVAHAVNLSRAEVYGVVTFYHDFRLNPAPKKVVRLCQSEACQAMGSRQLKAALETELGVTADDIQPGDQVAIETVYCLGNCALSPSAMVKQQVYGRVDGDKIKKLLEDV